MYDSNWKTEITLSEIIPETDFFWHFAMDTQRKHELPALLSGNLLAPPIWLDLVPLPRHTHLIAGIEPGDTWEHRGDKRGFLPPMASVIQQLQPLSAM